jgi:hypothetical protein
MLGIGTGLREMMTMSRRFKVISMVCMWFGNFWMNLLVWLFGREITYSFVGALKRKGFQD